MQEVPGDILEFCGFVLGGRGVSGVSSAGSTPLQHQETPPPHYTLVFWACLTLGYCSFFFGNMADLNRALWWPPHLCRERPELPMQPAWQDLMPHMWVAVLFLFDLQASGTLRGRRAG